MTRLMFYYTSGLLLLALLTSSHATDYYVQVGSTGKTCANMADACGDLISAINNFAGAGPHTIHMAPGTYPSNGNSNLSPAFNIEMIIEGAGQGLTVVDLSLKHMMSVVSSQKITFSKMSIINGFGDETKRGGTFKILGSSTDHPVLNLNYVDIINSTSAADLASTSIGGAIYNVGGTLNIESVQFLNCRSPVGGALYLEGHSTNNINNATFFGCKCTVPKCWGGAIVPEGNSVSNISNSLFENCEAPTGYGGAIDDGSNAQYTITNTVFRNNKATWGGAIYNYAFAWGRFINCSFINNEAEKTGGVFRVTTQANVDIIDSWFAYNKALSHGAIFTTSECTDERNLTYCTTVVGTVFIANSATSISGAIGISAPSLIRDCLFTDNWSLEAGGAVYLNSGDIADMSSLTFMNNTAPIAGAFYAGGTSDYELKDGFFYNNSARFIGHQGDATGLGGALHLTGGINFTFSGQLLIQGNDAASGGGISIATLGNVIFKDPFMIRSNKAANGGGMYTSSLSQTVLAAGSEFQSNTALFTGGAIYQDSLSTLKGSKIDFKSNAAQFGGSFGSATGELGCAEFIESSHVNNVASIAGGALYLGNTTTICDVCPNCVFSGNTAPIGPDKTSSPQQVVALTNISDSLYPSELFNASFYLQDIFGELTYPKNRVINLRLSDIVVPGIQREGGDDNSTVQILGPKVASFKNNTASFNFLQLNAPPGTTLTLEFFASPEIESYKHVISVAECPNNRVVWTEKGLYKCLQSREISQLVQIIITVVGGLLCCLGIAIAIWFIIHRESTVVREANRVFCLLAVAGVIILSACAIMWVWVTDATCGLRVWLLIVGFTLCYGFLIAKVYRLWKTEDDDDLLKSSKRTDGILWKVVLSALGVELIICMIWFIIAPYKKQVIVDYTQNQLTYTCASTQVTSVFFWILLALNLLILLAGCVLSLLARKKQFIFNEAKHLLASVYNFLVVLVVAVIVGWLFRDNPSVLGLIVSIALMYSSLLTLLCLFIPKLRLTGDKDPIKVSLLEDIESLERDISWKRKQLDELSTHTDASTSTMMNLQKTSPYDQYEEDVDLKGN